MGEPPGGQTLESAWLALQNVNGVTAKAATSDYTETKSRIPPNALDAPGGAPDLPSPNPQGDTEHLFALSK